ncbi:MAG: DoxX family protein [Candidatus Paceibacterota bacterium]
MYIPFLTEEIVLLISRLIVGAVMLYFGSNKITDLKTNAESFVKMGFKPGWFWGTIVAFVEFIGGLMILLGIFAWIPAILFGFQMIVGTIWKITNTDKPFTDWSYDLLLLALMLVIVIYGSGIYSVIN